MIQFYAHLEINVIDFLILCQLSWSRMFNCAIPLFIALHGYQIGNIVQTFTYIPIFSTQHSSNENHHEKYKHTKIKALTEMIVSVYLVVMIDRILQSQFIEKVSRKPKIWKRIWCYCCFYFH